MNKNYLQIVTTPRAEECIAKTWWESESSILQTTFQYPKKRSSQTAGNLEEHINKEFGIDNPFYRIIISEIDMVLEDKNRIHSIEIRTNPKNWLHVSLPTLPSNITSVWTTFKVDYDVNQIATVSVPVEILWDAQTCQVAFRFNGNSKHCQWNALADKVAVGHDNHGILYELRFADVIMA
jgi:hypothetical protein